MKKARSHTVLVRVTFDKPVGRRAARAAIRDCVHGEFYPAQFNDDDPGSFKISSIKPAPAILSNIEHFESFTGRK